MCFEAEEERREKCISERRKLRDKEIVKENHKLSYQMKENNGEE